MGARFLTPWGSTLPSVSATTSGQIRSALVDTEGRGLRIERFMLFLEWSDLNFVGGRVVRCGI